MTITMPMEAGPMQRGMASGTMLISSSSVRCFPAALSSRMSETAERKSRTPAPMRKASSVKPNREKIRAPKR